MPVRCCPKCKRLMNWNTVKCLCGETFAPPTAPEASVPPGPAGRGLRRRHVGSTRTSPTTVFVLGILGIVLCGLLAPGAWAMGRSYENECRSLGIPPDGLGTAGKILGIVGSISLVVGLILVMLRLLVFMRLTGRA